MSSGDRAGISILHVDDDSALADMVAEFLEREDDRFTVETAISVGDGLEHLRENHVDCVVSDYDMPGQNGIEFLEIIREEYRDLPFILYTGKGSEAVASDAIAAGVSDYLQKDRGTSQYMLLANRLQNAVEQFRANQRATNQQRINSVIRKINAALARATTRREIDEPICEIISNAKPYRFAWIGEVDHEAGTVIPRSTAGSGKEYLDAIEITTDDSPTGRGPTGRAVRTHELAVMQNIPEDPEYEPWREQALERGYRSSATIPLLYDDTLYGVLNVYADRTYAFDEHEQQLLSNLGETIAHAYHRIELNRKYTEQYRDVFEQAPVMVVFTCAADGEPIIEDCNQAFAERLGYTREELTETSLIDYYTDESAEEVLEGGGFQRALTGEFVREQRTFATREGEEVLTILRASPRRDRNGERIGTLGLFLDITDEKQVQELERTNALLSTLIDALPHGVIAEDSSRNVLAVNQQLLDLFEMPGPPEEIIGTDCDRMAEEVSDMFAESEEFVERIDDLIAERESADDEVLALTDDRTFERAYRPIEFSDGNGHLWVYRDVTERKNREQELIRQNDRLEQFAGIVSHDLRNPLTVADGRLKLAQDDCDSEHLDEVAYALDRMAKLMEDVLVLSREGDVIDEINPVKLSTVAENCWRMVDTSEATLRCASTATIRADRSRLAQMLENLFVNAVEHGGEDVTITVGTLEDYDGFYVEDDGRGIPADERARIFEEGYSGSESGTGLGLAIVRDIVAAHGWEIDVTDGDEGGERFEIIDIEFVE